MNAIARSVARRGHLAATHELYADGATRATVAAAVRLGAVLRVRQGWYVSPEVHPRLRESARVGGRATCSTGLELHGVWTHPDSRLHVVVPRQACRLRAPYDSRVRIGAALTTTEIHWRDSQSWERLLLPPFDCLTDVVACASREVTICAADSVLHTFPGLRTAWAAFMVSLPAAYGAILGEADGICESGTETLVWLRLKPHRMRLRRQVRIPGVGRVDFVIGERLVIEVDGREYHIDPQRFESDRRRDARLSALGYRVLRFSYAQVMYRWYEVEAAVLAAVSRGDHLR